MADNFHNIKGGVSLELNMLPTGLANGDLWFDGYSLNLMVDGYAQPSGAVESQNNGTTVESLTRVINFGDNLTASPGPFAGEIKVDLNAWIAISTPGSSPAVPGDKIFADTTGGAISIILPTSAPLGATVRIADPTSSWSGSALTIDPGSSPYKINGVLGPLSISTPNISYELVYYAPDNNWIVMTPRSVLGG